MAYAAERTSNTQNGVCHVKQDRGMGSGGNSFKVVCRHASCTYFSKCKKNTRGEWVFVERSGHICGFNVNQGAPNIGNTPVMASICRKGIFPPGFCKKWELFNSQSNRITTQASRHIMRCRHVLSGQCATCFRCVY